MGDLSEEKYNNSKKMFFAIALCSQNNALLTSYYNHTVGYNDIIRYISKTDALWTVIFPVQLF